MAGQHWPPSWGTGTLLSFVYTCGEKRVVSGGSLPDRSLEIKEKESLILGEVIEGKIKPWISEQVREERGVYFGGEDAVSVHERPASLHMRSFELSLGVTIFASYSWALESLPCAPEGEVHPLSPPRAQALGALMLTAHLQPTLQGAAERSEREPGALCQDLETQVNILLE